MCWVPILVLHAALTVSVISATSVWVSIIAVGVSGITGATDGMVILVSWVLRGLRCPYCHGFATLAASVTGATGVSDAALLPCKLLLKVSWEPLVSQVTL